MERLKNYGLWVALTAFVLDVCIFAGVIDVTQSQEIEMLVQRALEIAVVAGLLNNPSLGGGFKDHRTSNTNK